MVEKLPLNISQKIQIRRKDAKEWFNSSVQDIRDGHYININMPFIKERPLVLRRNEKVVVRFFSEQSSFNFSTKVIGEVSDNIKLYRLDYPQEIIRVQQRNHVRLPIILDIKYTLPEENKDNKKKIIFRKTTTVDLSGGGMKLLTREKIEPGTKILLVFSLPLKNRPELIEINSLVARCIKVEPDREVYHIGIKFKDINLNQEDKIVRFIFEKMAQQKRLR